MVVLKKNKLFVVYRIMNLELMSECGAEAWKSHNSYLQQALTQAQSQLQAIK